MKVFSRTASKAAFLAVALLVPTLLTAQTYSGPKCLGPFCIDRKLSPETLFNKIGKPASNWWGYRSQDRRAFLLVLGGFAKDAVGGIRLSDSSGLKPSKDKILTVTDKVDLRAWKTGEGIGLGSEEEDVLKAYGKPSGAMSAIPKEGSDQAEEKRLIYKGRVGEVLSAAYFHVQNGKISLIELSNVEDPGPFCIGLLCTLGLSTGNLFKQLGTPLQKSALGSTTCLQSQDGLTFLSVETGHEEPPEVDVAFLSDFPNCMHIAKKVTESDLHAWKTSEGIGLGSLEEDVLKVYGKPSEEKVSSKARWDYKIRGFRKGDKPPDVGEKILSYRGMELHWAEFGIRDGKVSYILISDSE